MNVKETKISLVGWGDWQVMFHSINGAPGLSVVRGGRIVQFGMAPWLHGLVATYAQHHPFQLSSNGVNNTLRLMRIKAFFIAERAIRNQDVKLLAKAVETTYQAQQIMGAKPLPHKGELAKRSAGIASLYLFGKPCPAKQKSSVI
jgi:hypothetical protein